MGFVEDIITGFQSGLDKWVQRLLDTIGKELFEPLLQLIFGLITKTPYPNNIYSFGAPTNGDWPAFYNQIYVPKIQFLITPLFGLVLGLAMFFNIFSKKQKKLVIRRAIFVYPFAWCWWWFGGWFLKFNNDLANFLVADSAQKMTNNVGSLLLSVGGGIGVGIVVYTFGALVLFALIMIFVLREIAIYAYMVGMPVLLLAWVVPIDSVQGWAESQMGKFVPLVLMTAPAALFIDIGATLLASSSGGEGAVMGLATIASSGWVAKAMFSYSSQISNAVRSGTDVGRHAAAGASGGGQRQQRPPGNRGGGSSPPPSGTGVGGAGGSGDSTQGDQFSHKGGVDFSPSMSRRRRQRRRAEKVGRGARKAASKTKQTVKGGAAGAGNRLVESGAKNYYRDENTAKGMAKDALSSGAGTVIEAGEQPLNAKQRLKQGTSKRMQRIDRRIKARQKELKQQYDPRANVDAESQRAVHMGGESRSSDSDGDGNQSPRTTYSRNQSSRHVGSVGSSTESDSDGGE